MGILIINGEIADMEKKGERCFVGCIIAEKLINKEAFLSMMLKLWKTRGKIGFNEIEEKLWLIEFSEEQNKRRVWEGRPWLFDGNLIVLQDFDEITPLAKMCF